MPPKRSSLAFASISSFLRCAAERLLGLPARRKESSWRNSSQDGYNHGNNKNGFHRRNPHEIWSGRRDLNPRLRPWQGRTLPLSYSRSGTTIINDASRPDNETANASLVMGPLRVLFGIDNLPIPHVDDAIAILGRLGIVCDHQNGLPQFLIRLAQHPQYNVRIL